MSFGDKKNINFPDNIKFDNYFEQCFQNRTGHQTRKVIGSWFTGRTDGQTAVEPVTSKIYILYFIKIKIIIKYLKYIIKNEIILIILFIHFYINVLMV